MLKMDSQGPHDSRSFSAVYNQGVGLAAIAGLRASDLF